MIAPTQREALSLLAEVVELSPDVRLGQLFAHLGFLGEDQTGRSLGDIDDEELLTVLYHHLGELTARLPGGPEEAPRPTAAVTSIPGSSVVAEVAPGD